MTILEKGEKGIIIDPQSYSSVHGGADIDYFLLEKYSKMFSADIRILIRPVIETALKLYCTRTDALSDPDKVFDLLNNDSLVKLKDKFESEP